MLPRKAPAAQEADLYPSDTDPAVFNTIARAGESRDSKSDDEKIHIFWRVFGGAILSIVALVGITLYNNVQSNITELRAEHAKLMEARGEYIRKDEFNTRITNNYDRISNVQTQTSTQAATLLSLKTELDAAKERLTKSGAEAEAFKKDVAVIEVLKEKLTQMQADLKTVREDAFKAKAEIEKNQLADQERKQRRDDQAKEFEKTIKEMNAAVQDCLVKLARLEGKQETKPPETKPKVTP